MEKWIVGSRVYQWLPEVHVPTELPPEGTVQSSKALRRCSIIKLEGGWMSQPALSRACDVAANSTIQGLNVPTHIPP